MLHEGDGGVCLRLDPVQLSLEGGEGRGVLGGELALEGLDRGAEDCKSNVRMERGFMERVDKCVAQGVGEGTRVPCSQHLAQPSSTPPCANSDFREVMVP